MQRYRVQEITDGRQGDDRAIGMLDLKAKIDVSPAGGGRRGRGDSRRDDWCAGYPQGVQTCQRPIPHRLVRAACSHIRNHAAPASPFLGDQRDGVVPPDHQPGFDDQENDKEKP